MFIHTAYNLSGIWHLLTMFNRRRRPVRDLLRNFAMYMRIAASVF